MSKTGTISILLNQIRRAALKRDAIVLAWIGYCIGIIAVVSLILLESVFYFSPGIRYGLWWVGLAGLILIMTGLVLLIFLVQSDLIGRYRQTELARKTGALAFDRDDSVVNALQLERSLDNTGSADLSISYIQSVADELDRIDVNRLFPTETVVNWKRNTLITLTSAFLVLIFTWNSSSQAVYRWAHPRTNFPVPKPFELFTDTGHIHLLGGDSVTIHIRGQGFIPDSVHLELVPGSREKETKITAAKDTSGLFSFHLADVTQNYQYRSFVSAERFWEAWEEITTPFYNIRVTDRPIIEDFTISVIPPKYTGLPLETQNSQKTNIEGIKGSTIEIRLKSNRSLARTKIQFNQDTLALMIRGRKAEGRFTAEKDEQFTVHLEDKRGIKNRNPIPYRLNVLPDLHPELSVLQPPPIIELGSHQLLDLQVNIKDDFGFSTLQVGYEIHRPSYIQAEPILSIFTIPIPDEDALDQDIETLWNLSDLGLMPEDEVHYHFELYDNDLVSGPKKAITGTFIARVPSLADLFASFDEAESKIIDEAELNLNELEDLQKTLDEIELELRKATGLEWNQEQQVRKALEQTRNRVETLQKIAEELEALSNIGEKHELFSPKLMEKFEQLQNLVNEIISPEFLKSLDRVDEALAKMDTKDLSSALRDMSKKMEKLEADIDRFIDIFKQVQAEQKMEEIKTRLDQLVHNQERLSEEINQTDDNTKPSDFARMSQEEQRNSEEFSNIDRTMKEAHQILEKVSPASAEALKKLRRSEQMSSTKMEFGRTIQQLNRKRGEQAGEFSRDVLQGLQEIQRQIADIHENFQMQTTRQITNEFRQIMRNVLSLSKSQEELMGDTQLMSRNSPRLKETAVQQQMLQDQMTQIMVQAMELSRKTFAITPQMGKAMGMTYAQMEAAKSKLAERNSTGAKSNQESAMQSLNEAALAIMNAMEEMQASGSASGFEQFLKRMQDMANRQGGINEQGLQLALGQMAASLQKALMQRMLQEQKGVRKSLQQLSEEMHRSGKKGLGDLDGIASEMDEVIYDLERKRFTRQTVDRQQRILSRMLDSQKSLTQRGYKDERKSETAEQVVYSGPSGLPEDLGQRRNLALEALNKAMKFGYSKEYKAMIRRYFHTLSQFELLRENPSQQEEPEQQ